MPPSSEHALERLGRLPSLIAIPLRDYLREEHPVLRLHRLCDAAEILTRFLTVVALGEVRRVTGGAPLPARLVRALQPNIERPTLGRWRDMLAALVSEPIADNELVLPEMPEFARRELIAALAAAIDTESDAGKGRRDARSSESMLVLRNDLAHGLAITAAAAQALLERWERWADQLIAKLTFLEGIDVCAVAGGAARRLVGPSIERGSAVAALELAGGSLEQLDGHVILLERERAGMRQRRLLDLWPLCDYGAGQRAGDAARPAHSGGPMLYFRYEYDRLLYAALGVDLPRAEISDDAVIQQFRGLFQLETPVAPTAGRALNFENEIRRDSDALVGRRDEIRAAKRAIREIQSGVAWLSGSAGIGKSFVMARLAVDLGNARSTCRIAWRFKVGDVASCNRHAFFHHAVERLAAFIARPDIVPARDPRDLEGQLSAILDFIAQLPPAPRPRRICVFLDGLDEIARVDPDFLRIPFELVRPELVWVCAGQPTDVVTRAFDPARCRIVFPGGLPTMRDEDIRGMLVDDTGSLKYGLLQRDTETIDARTGQAAVDNPVVRAVCDRAAGLPLLVHFVIQDLLSGHFSFANLESQLPPPGLESYYDDLLRRVPIGELQAVLTPLVTAIVWAEAPVDEPTLLLLLRQRRVLPADEAGGRALLRRALEAVRMMIRPADPGGRAADGGPLPAWELYHNDLRLHIRRDRAGIIGSQNGLAREAFCDLTAGWRAIPAGHPALSYMLHYGPLHLIAAQDWRRLAELVRARDFLEATAARFGTVVALENARAIALALAAAGTGYWNDLLLCADSYCRFSEAIRSSPSILEDVIRRGQVQEARDIIGRQPDEFLRGVLMVATAPLAEAAGHAEAAAEMQAQGRTIVNEKLAQGVGVGDWYKPETKGLIAVLESYRPRVLNFPPLDVDAIARTLAPDAARSDAPQRTRLPLSLRLLAHAGSVRARVYSAQSIWIGASLMLYDLAYALISATHMTRNASGKALLSPDFAAWLALPFLVGIIWIFVGGIFFGAVESMLKRGSARYGQALRDVAAAVERLSAAERERHYARLLHFFHLTKPAPLAADCEDIVAYWTVRYFEQLCDQPARMADLVIDTSRMWPSTLGALAPGMERLEPPLLRRIFDDVLRRALTVADYNALLFLLVPVVARTGYVDLLVKCLERYRRLTNKDTIKAEAQQQAGVLCCLSEADLGRAVLASLHREAAAEGGRIRDGLVGAVCKLPLMEQVRGAARSPFELTAAVMLIMPYPIYIWVLLVIGVTLVVVPSILLLLSGGAPFDPYALTRRCRDKSAAEIRRLLAQTLVGTDFSWKSWRLGARITSGWVLAPAALNYVRRCVIAQNILRDERVEIAASAHVVQRVLAWFIRHGLYGRPEEVVLKVMDDRRLLAAVQEVAAPVASAAGAAPPAPPEDRTQLLRVLAPHSLIVNALVAVVLAAVITACWLGLDMLAWPADFETWLWPYGAAAVAAGCGFVIVVQHLYLALRVDRLAPWLVETIVRHWQRLKSALRHKPATAVQPRRISVRTVAVWYQIMFGCMVIAMLYHFGSLARERAFALDLPYPMGRSDTPFIFGVGALAILTVKVVTPSVVASWRGSRLLYPKPRRLWRERLRIAPQLALGAVLLALLAHWEMASGATRPSLAGASGRELHDTTDLAAPRLTGRDY